MFAVNVWHYLESIAGSGGDASSVLQNSSNEHLHLELSIIGKLYSTFFHQDRNKGKMSKLISETWSSEVRRCLLWLCDKDQETEVFLKVRDLKRISWGWNDPVCGENMSGC